MEIAFPTKPNSIIALLFNQNHDFQTLKGENEFFVFLGQRYNNLQ